MSIRKRSWTNADGTASTRWIVDIQGRDGHRERRQFDSRKEAEAFRIETEGQMRAGTFRGAAAKFTVKHAADRFLDHCRGRQQRGERMTRQNLKTMEGHIGTKSAATEAAPGQSQAVTPPEQLRQRDRRHYAVAAHDPRGRRFP